MNASRALAFALPLLGWVMPAPVAAQQTTTSASCDELASPAVIEELLALSQDAFDQDMDGGWRPIADGGCYLEAAEIIDQYLEARRELAADPQAGSLWFHAGQMYAYAGRIAPAIERFEASRMPASIIASLASGGNEEIVRGLRATDAYLDATIAFLRGDLEALREAHAGVAAGPRLPDGRVMNLHIVERFLEGFGRPYAEVYGGS